MGATLAGLMLMAPFPGPALLLFLGGVLLTGAVSAAVIRDQALRHASAPEIAHYRSFGERLDAGLERLHDLQWELSDREARYRDLLDRQTDLITRTTPDGRFTFVNRAFCRAFGVEPGAVLGTPYRIEVLQGEGEPVAAPAVTGVRRRTEELVTTADGPRWFAIEAQAIAGQDGRVSEEQRVWRDVTEERRAETALAEARDQAEAANRAKSRFLAAMSHEIRTPMNGILGMTNLILETPLSAEQKTYMAAIDHSAKTLLRIIDEILDLSKIEAGKLEIHPAPFRLDECVQGVVELLSPRAREKGLDIGWRIEPDLPRVVAGDETRIRQVLLNLIGNAIKFTDGGGVGVRVRRGAEPVSGEADLTLEVEVTDTGVGIPADRLDTLFAEFAQVDDAVKRRRSGTGLGLAISRRLAQAMGGDIRVSSAPGQGSTFVLQIRIGTEEATQQVLTQGDDAHRQRALIVSARPMQPSLMRETLESIGIASVVAAPSAAGDAIADAAARSEPFNALIVDAETGAGAIARLVGALRTRAGGETRALLVCDQPGHRNLDQFQAAGCDAYLVRPVRPVSLVKQLACAVEPPDAALPAPRPHAAAASPLGSAKRVLLVEDNDINALLARRMCERAGCTVHHAKGGGSALGWCEAFLAAPDGRLDIVLMDIHMPDMDGFEAARRIRRLFASRGRPAPPIVALTANAFAEDRRRCIENGLEDFLAKPFDQAELAALLEKWCPSGASPRDGRLGGEAA